MDTQKLQHLMRQVAEGSLAPDEATLRLRDLPFEDLGFARVDHHRALRQGWPEVIFCPGKTPAQVAAIAASLHRQGTSVLATRANPDMYQAVAASLPDAVWHESARLITVAGDQPPVPLPGKAGVVCAGTGDLPVAEEAACCLEAMGATVLRIADVGVAGVHRLLHCAPLLRECAVIIAVAGMEGAMPSVVAGLVETPVLAVPTSIGYGASFGGLAALLGMLNSCASGVAVVNIDNGFGAAAMAAAILRGRTEGVANELPASSTPEPSSS